MMRFHCPWVTSCLAIQNPSSRTGRTGFSSLSHFPALAWQPISNDPPGTNTNSMPVTGSFHSLAPAVPMVNKQNDRINITRFISTSHDGYCRTVELWGIFFGFYHNWHWKRTQGEAGRTRPRFRRQAEKREKPVPPGESPAGLGWEYTDYGWKSANICSSTAWDSSREDFSSTGCLR